MGGIIAWVSFLDLERDLSGEDVRLGRCLEESGLDRSGVSGRLRLSRWRIRRSSCMGK